MGGLEKILNSMEGDFFEGKLAVSVCRISTTAICGAYLLVYFVLSPEYGLIYDPRIFVSHLCEYNYLFNSLSIVIIVVFLSMISIIPGLAAIFYGLLGIRERQEIHIVLWGLVSFCVGTINFYIVLKICTPS